ncbi:MBL fold metallo-hydrolase [Bradyrhizobium sp. CCGUVB4N]|uniref:GAF domain-containing protein n=1 Tax=Bradyrhizobium sp. CCGUVB4N TaxID=2949631 RepID=UPI0020B2B2B4|nr:GAF domain-containing protein [Bradyrhizobium sp. CCGUVB4N]MCP3384763.1 MBL fold metallo-hydrolase [Bradyrhizobium sp. CCGUVB4N]
MQVQFWGTRGSIPKPGPTTIRYGGNTLCVEVRTARGTLVIIDCGTGLHGLGLKLMSGGVKNLAGHILISHTHWDHIQGVPFFVPFFVSGTKWDIYGPKGLNQSLRETLAGQMQHTYFPVTTDEFGATIRYHDLVEGTFEIDDVKVTTQYLNHPALTLGYRLEADGVAAVYCCDHEPFSRALAEGNGEFSVLDQRHADFIEGADLLIHDAQYTAAEYPSKVGWGHSTGEFVVKLAQRSHVKHVALAHHDPLRNDDAVERIVEKLRADLRADGSALVVSASAEGEVISLEASDARAPHVAGEEFSALTPLEPALVQRSILISVTDPKIAAALTGAASAEGLRANFCASAEAAQAIISRDPPSLAIIDRDAARDSRGICEAIRGMNDDNLPVVAIAGDEDTEDGVKDWLITPFTESYARTKMRAWVLREACRWVRAPVPEDEEKRLASMRELGLLDSPPEERFDRITRLAVALFNVPMATITFIDENRQWFKSRQGVAVQENPRDVSFCAHVVYHREPVIVSDALRDDRVADNPLVRGGPRIRFYAGYPLNLADGTCIGTLCLLDTRPRDMSEDQLAQLKDLAGIAADEIRAIDSKVKRFA